MALGFFRYMDEMKKKNVKNIAVRVSVLLLISIIIELFVFNIRFFQSILYESSPFDASNTIAIEGAHLLADGSSELDDDTDSFTVIIGNINRKLKNIRMDVENIDEEVSIYTEDHVCDVKVAVWDDALHEKMGDDGTTYLESGMYDLTEKKILRSVPESEYIWLETFGETKAVRLTISSVSGRGRQFKLNDITFNATQDLKIKFVRLFVIFIALCVCYIVLFERTVWKADCVTPAKWKTAVPLVLFLFAAVGAFAWATANPSVFGPDQNEYAPLARALLNGTPSVGDAGDLVKNADGKIVFWNMTSSEVMFDYAYYDGKYYVYFGVLPCLVMFLPYLLLTGRDLPNFVPVVLMCLAILAEIYIFLGMLIRRYYRNTPFMARLLMTAAACGGMYILSFISVPDHYMVAISFGLILSLAGIMCWIKALPFESFKTAQTDYTVHIGYLTAGSACMAAVSLCRPTLLIVGFAFLLVILVTDGKAIAGMDKRKLLQCMLAVAIPYIIFAALCMYYNYIRFDSPFDFGASRNMTTIPFNGGKGFLPFLIARAIYEYLFAPAVFKAEYPFFFYERWGQITEGSSILAVTKPDIGLFTGTPVLWLGLLCIGYRKSLKQKKLLLPIVAMFFSAFLLMTFATRFTFCLTERYTLEFSLIFFVIAFIGMMELYEDMKDKAGARLMGAVFLGIRLLLLAAVVYGSLQLFPEKWTYNLSCGNTELYYRIYYAMNFML